ncbi:ribosomal protein L26-like protein [Camelus ferus]|nr:ribosomal protein L26-like protein [Camelus ferus]
MKFNPFVTSDRSRNRKRHFSAPSHVRRKITSSPLSKELRQKYNVRSMPIRKDDEVQRKPNPLSRNFQSSCSSPLVYLSSTLPPSSSPLTEEAKSLFLSKGQQIGKGVQGYRKKRVIYIKRVQREKANGTTVPVGIHLSRDQAVVPAREHNVPAGVVGCRYRLHSFGGLMLVRSPLGVASDQCACPALVSPRQSGTFCRQGQSDRPACLSKT